jgi:1-acyl-sn-glycerol-3-phosphate acyltransferase
MCIVGAEHVPLQGGVLLASNHISLLDPVLVPYAVMATQGVQIVWAPAKVELFSVPLLGRLITSLGAFPVRRGRGDVGAMRRMIRHMQTEKLLLFPEGTRSRDGRLGRGQRTVGKLLHAARPVVIPTAVWGTDQVLPPGSALPRWRTQIGVRYGQPLDLQRYYALPGTRETAVAIVQEIMQAIAALIAIDRPTTAIAPTKTSRQGYHDEASSV